MSDDTIDDYDADDDQSNDRIDAEPEDETTPKSRHGGWRPNGGRKHGSTNNVNAALSKSEKDKMTRHARTASKMDVAKQRVDEAMDQIGLTMAGTEFESFGPLETLTFSMQAYLLASKSANDLETRMRWMGAAASVAKDLAPYVAPKLTSIDVNARVNRSVDDLSDAELMAIAMGKKLG